MENVSSKFQYKPSEQLVKPVPIHVIQATPPECHYHATPLIGPAAAPMLLTHVTPVKPKSACPARLPPQPHSVYYIILGNTTVFLIFALGTYDLCVFRIYIWIYILFCAERSYWILRAYDIAILSRININ